MRKQSVLALSGVLIGSLAFASAARAESISVQFVGSGTAIPANSTATGVFAVPGSDFNVVATPAQTNNGSATVSSDTADTTNLTWSGANLYNSGGAGNNNAALLSGYLDNNNSTPATASLTLPAGIAGTGSTPYNVIIYVAGDTTGRGGTATVNGTTVTLTELANNGTGNFVLSGPSTPGNYYEFFGVTGTTLNISNLGVFGNTAGGDGTPRLPLDGFQVVSTPEPASMALLGFGGLGLLARRRRA